MLFNKKNLSLVIDWSFKSGIVTLAVFLMTQAKAMFEEDPTMGLGLVISVIVLLAVFAYLVELQVKEKVYEELTKELQ